MKRVTDLLQAFKSKRKLELGEVAKLLNLSEASTLIWARTLKQDNILDMVQEGGKTYFVLLSPQKPTLLKEPEKKLLPEAAQEEMISPKQLSKLIEDYAVKIDEMKKKSAELINMERERSNILYKDYVPLERRFEVELHLINEQLADKESTIKELESRIKEVPRRISLIESQAAKLEKIESYIRFSLDKSRVRIEKEVDRIEEIRALVEKYTSEVNRRIQDQTSNLRNVQKELARLKKMEDWIYLQQDMLEKNMKDYSQMRKQSLTELDELRDIMRTGFLKRYERELRKMQEMHLEEIGKIKAREKEFQQRIEAEGKELARLNEESDRIVKAFELLSKKKIKVEEQVEKEKSFVGELERVPAGGIE
jgi:predicted  nucleic acid-binding Zn-ribbon protein